ncbi:MAG: AsmA family protein [Proteobacteria bacterium]|nr:AsmA family protein [Pseudomonadota bacterium]
MRWLRVLAVATAILLVTLVLAAVAAVQWVDVAQIAREQVLAATGRELALGSARFVLAPQLGLRVEDVALENAAWGSEPRMLSAEVVEVRLRLMPLLLRQRVVLRRVEVRGARVLIESDERGRSNWNFERAEAPGPAEPEGEHDGEAGSDAIPRIERLEIVDSTLVFRDGISGESHELGLARVRFGAPTASALVATNLEGEYDGEPFRVEGTHTRASDVLDGAPLVLDLRVTAGGAQLELAGSIEAPLESSGIELRIALAGESLAALSGLAGAALPSLGPYRLAASLSGGPDAFRARDLTLSVGTSELHGELAGEFGAERPRPRLEATLASQHLALSDFSDAKPGATPAGGEDAGDERVFSDEPLPIDGLLRLDGALHLHVEQIELDETDIRDLELVASLEDGVLEIRLGKARLAEGVVSWEGTVDAASSPPAIAVRAQVEGVEAGALLQSLRVSDVLSEGRVDGALALEGEGRSLRALMASWSGTLQATMGPGDIDSAFARLVFTDLASLLIPKGANGQSTGDEHGALNCIIARFGLSGGVALADELVLDTKGLALFGSGGVDLGREAIDLFFDPLPKQRNLTVVMPPVLVGGTLAHPSYGTSTAELARGALRTTTRLLLKQKMDLGGVKTEPGIGGCRQLLEEQARRLQGEQSALIEAPLQAVKQAGEMLGGAGEEAPEP